MKFGIKCGLVFLALFCNYFYSSSAIIHNPENLALIEQADEPNPLLAVLIMVKNEATVMRDTMEPLIQAGIRSFLILDTGSTDNTIEVVQQIYADYSITDGYIVEQPFIDFATSRNYALQCAEELFPHAGFFFMIDAEWYVQNPEQLLPLCAQYYYTPFHVFAVTISVGASEEITANRLFRAHQGAFFVGAVHEYIALDTVNIATPIYVKYSPRTAGLQKSIARLERDLTMLQESHRKEPEVVRYAFFIGQTYHCMQEIEKAAEWYDKASQMEGWDELLFISKHRAAQCYEALGNWPLALATYLKAYAMRPTRAEPLVSIAIYYWNNGCPLLAYMFAQQALNIPYPDLDCCYINKVIYYEHRYDILARAAWFLGKYQEGLQAIMQGLKHNPQSEQFNNLLQIYSSKITQS